MQWYLLGGVLYTTLCLNLDMEFMRNVLIIEDDHHITDLIVIILQNLGCRPTTAFDVESAMIGFAPKVYDLVISDVFMEGAGGIAGITKIRAIDLDVPIIVVSAGYGSISPADTIRAAKKIGANYGLAKPFLIDALIDMINKAFDDGADIGLS